MKKLALVHTSATLIPVFQELCQAFLPGVQVFNIVDDFLVKNIIASGSLTPTIAKQVVGYVESAQMGGADQVLVTCSSIGPAVELSEHLVDIPVLRVDQPMADKAVAMGTRIGVIATLSSTLEPTADLISRRAEVASKEIHLEAVLCEGAFDALMRGDAATHDQKVTEVLKQLASKVDVIVLAQASMARVVASLNPNEKKVPILSSPQIAIEYLASQQALS